MEGTKWLSPLKAVRSLFWLLHGFEQTELTEPQKALKNAGAIVHVVSPELGSIRGFQHLDPGENITVDRALSEAKADDYDALVIPGGLYNPDELRTNEAALQFVREFFKAGKPVGAICHGPQVLISADLVKGRTLTAVTPIRVDLTNAGANVLDQEVVTDKGLVTSRTPKDLPAFCAKLIEEIGEGRHRRSGAPPSKAAKMPGRGPVPRPAPDLSSQ